MKKIKAILISAMTMLTAIASMLSVSAENMLEISDDEVSQIISAIEEENKKCPDSDDLSSIVSPEDEIYDTESVIKLLMPISGYDIKDAYKIYILEHLIITDYKERQDFKSLITDYSNIMLPADGVLATIKEVDSKYQVSSRAFTNDTFDFNELMPNVINSIDEEIVNVIHTYSFTYYMDIIYIETVDNEYAVPYFKFSYDLNGNITSGTIYTVSEFMDRMEATFDEAYMITHGNENGGVPLKNISYDAQNVNNINNVNNVDITDNSTSGNYFTIIVIVTAVIIFAAILIASIFFNRKKFKSNKQ